MFARKSKFSQTDQVSLYVEMWKQSVEVQKHFNEIEWRIRGLALTVATFALGAAGWTARDGATVGPFSLGALVVVLGLLLWYAFYFVDRAWYHPLLKAAVKHGEALEQEIMRSLPVAGMTQAITAGSPYEPSRVVAILSGKRTGPMHSEDKLVWFYKVGAAALVVAAIALQSATSFAFASTGPEELVVRVEHDTSQRSHGAPAGSAARAR
ncbi:hypothetical protein [Cellulomonas pakistanensis]|uniref:Uncharacterized protein n=1 Tax=Cellulomonas pakistanensis TaxID=992287 RepID=A0A919P8F9_9CELL|nr:hypothetical protein [Cellulomonas pakistanensis]GIG36299.1 hypothetical protein Cpa01nite_16800 [Cellulomonas pakistanensis]